MRLMKKTGCNFMSVGIFSWAVIEKEENSFDFSFLDRIMDTLHQNGIGAVLATPSAAMPNWLYKKYPEVLRTDEHYVRKTQAMRADNCKTSVIFREKVHKINEMLAKRYKNHPALKMWHVSNEYHDICYCEYCRKAFRDWLRKKYNNDLDLLNKKLWNNFWSASYSSWDEIEPPIEGGRHCGSGLYLEWRRWQTVQTIDFFRNEAEPLRRITPSVPITTNFHGDLSDVDYRLFKDEVDVISWDIYPQWHSGDDIYTSSEASFVYDLCRSIKDKPFLIMENTPSAMSIPSINKAKKPGMNILSSMHTIGHGADMIGFFQWRKGLGGYEKMHGAIVDHSGRDDTRIFKEVEKLGGLISQMGEICGSKTKSEAAIIYDWECRWTLDKVYAYNAADKKYKETCIKHYDYFCRHGISVDVIGQTQYFSQYKIIVAPMLYLCRSDTIKRLEEYVRNGGILVMTYISGICDEHDLCYYGGYPGGDLKKVFGIWAEETDVLLPEETNAVIYDGKTYTAKDYCEIIHADTAKPLAYFGSGWYKDMPAVTENNYGSGKAFYIGFRDSEDFIEDFYNKITADIKRLDPPEGVRMSERYSDDSQYLFIQNFNTTAAAVNIPKGFVTIDGKSVPETYELKGYETMVLKK